MCSLPNIQAQKNSKTKVPFEFSLQEATTISLKKMTLALDLTLSQQKEIQPIISEMISHKREISKEKERSKNSLNKAQTFAKINNHLDFKIAIKKKIKDILNSKQYEQFSQARTKKKDGEIAKRRKKHHREKNSEMS